MTTPKASTPVPPGSSTPMIAMTATSPETCGRAARPPETMSAPATSAVRSEVRTASAPASGPATPEASCATAMTRLTRS